MELVSSRGELEYIECLVPIHKVTLYMQMVRHLLVYALLLVYIVGYENSGHSVIVMVEL